MLHLTADSSLFKPSLRKFGNLSPLRTTFAVMSTDSFVSIFSFETNSLLTGVFKLFLSKFANQIKIIVVKF